MLYGGARRASQEVPRFRLVPPLPASWPPLVLLLSPLSGLGKEEGGKEEELRKGSAELEQGRVGGAEAAELPGQEGSFWPQGSGGLGPLPNQFIAKDYYAWLPQHLEAHEMVQHWMGHVSLGWFECKPGSLWARTIAMGCIQGRVLSSPVAFAVCSLS